MTEFCKKCGADRRGAAIRCIRCGEGFDTTICYGCGATYPADDVACPLCNGRTVPDTYAQMCGHPFGAGKSLEDIIEISNFGELGAHW